MRIETSAISAIQQYSCIVKKEKADTAVTMGSDRVELSSDAVTFGALVRQVKQGIAQPAQDYADRVESLEKRVRDGSYTASSELIVDALLS